MQRVYVLVFFLLCSPLAEAEPRELKIGVIQSLTGIAADDGKTAVQSVQLAAEELAKKGVRIQLIIEDDQTSPKNSVTALQNIAAKQPDAIIGATWDFVTNPLLPISGKQKIVLFNTTVPPESLDLTQSNGYGFTNSISAEADAEPFKHYLKLHPAQRVVVVYANNTWGETQARIYRRIANDRQIEVLDELKSSSFDENEWRNIIPRIKTKNPDLTILLLNRSDIAVFLKRAKEVDLRTTFFASKNGLDAYQFEDNKSLFDGLCFTYPLKRLRSDSSFVKSYRDRFSEEPRINADSTYDAIHILTEAHAVAVKDNISLRDALLKIEVKGLVGNYKYQVKKSFSLGDSSLVCIKDGAMQIEE